MTPFTTIRDRLCRSLGLTPLLLALVLLPASASASAHEAGRLSRAASTGACSLPLTHDRYDGFHIGVPVGWELSTFNDTIAVARDTSGSEEAIVYPALLTKGLTPATFFAAYSQLLRKSAAAAGNLLSFHVTSTPSQLPQAIVTGRAGKVVVQGRATVRLMRYQTQRAADQIVFSAYWAPIARGAADSAMLASIGRCYGPEAGTLYQLIQGQVFAFALPQGWQVADEGQDNVDL
ncbi:MAG TPA: hypothetical protein VHB98_11585, partial [Chloroflexota bacterium]|nr:hypothetical protein [Chloroflexota bacterium]